MLRSHVTNAAAVTVLRTIVLSALVIVAASCARSARVGPETPDPAAATRQVSRLHALLVNGGGRKQINYQSHLLHLGELRELLLDSGVPAERIAVFSSDGEDPGEDVALRATQPEEDFWRLAGTRVAGPLRMPTVFESSQIDGTALRPATQEALTAWFDAAAADIESGDTLLVYVTDHGEKNRADSSDNTITLWGKGEALSVNELRALRHKLDPGVRVVMLMSQCFSGSFANLIHSATGQADGGDDFDDGVCGYFSTTADRLAYGCYAENLGRENIGHSFRFIHALARSGSFDEAHADILVTDVTPDVPQRTSDFYTERMLRAAADEEGVPFEELVDRLLTEAWKDKGRWEPEIRLLDRIGKAFGYFSPRSLAELAEQTSRLPEIAGQMKRVSNAWQQSLMDANRANLGRLAAASPDWKERLDGATKGQLDQVQARMLTAELLRDATELSRRDPGIEERIVALHSGSEDTGATSYRMEVRLAVVLRMRTVLVDIAGHVYLDTRATRRQRARHRSLVACEDLRIPPTPALARKLDEPEPFPAFTDDVETSTAALPAWMGINFREVDATTREKLDLYEGAARVITVYPGSPAEGSGLRTADIVVGPPGRPFDEARRIRSWTMLSPIGVAQQLDVIRDGEAVEVSLVPGRYPVKWPELPGPPEDGSDAPAIELNPYRGEVPSRLAGGPYLLFFWATWCAPCKAAVPELLELEAAGVAPVIAITDENTEQLDRFFAKSPDFPANVAIDEYRQSFRSYGVSGTPRFVMVDGDGKVASQSAGYSPQTGLDPLLRELMGAASDELSAR